MCGICGYVGIDDKLLIEQMKNRIKHRGPDSHGTYYDNEYNLALGHQRLSIIDLTEQASQPMRYGNEDLYIVFNGEIYNYVELKGELLQKGYEFVSNSDTEVILASYKEWGETCLQHFNGMFSFVLWDKKRQQLFCARDRFGEKPFYYYYDKTKKIFVFASEIKALLAYDGIEREPNDDIIFDFLVQGLLDHSNQTFFKNIYKLQPAHFFLLSVFPEMELHTECYWSFNVCEKVTTKAPSTEVLDTFRNKLEKSINLRLRSDVAVGSCLSGGLDSSTIVLMVNRLLGEKTNLKEQLGKRQKAFTFCSDHPDFDERKFAEEIIAVTNVEKNFIFATAEDLMRELRELVYYQEEPFVSSSIYAQWCIMKAVKKRGVKVLLDGQGADEVLGGYRKYRIYLLKEYIRKGYWFKAIREFTAGLLQVKKSYNFKQDLVKVFNILGIKSRPKFRDYILANFQERYADKYVVRPRNLSEALHLDMTKYSIPSLLRYEDKNSMAFSIEARVPFLDHEIVEFVNSLPYNYKINGGWSKWIMRDAMNGILPNKVRMRKDKMGFVTTEKIWIKEKSEEFFEILSEAKRCKNLIVNYINLDKVIDDFPQIVNGKSEANLWRIISLTLWFDVYFSTSITNNGE